MIKTLILFQYTDLEETIFNKFNNIQIILITKQRTLKNNSILSQDPKINIVLEEIYQDMRKQNTV